MPIYRRAAAGLGFVPQEREIFPSLTVRENLEVGARPGHWTHGARVRAVPEPRRSGWATRATSSPAASSRCCRSRARCSPIRRVLLMDEPTEGLAPVIVEALTAVLVRLRSESGLSIVLVEQNSRVALEFSPRTRGDGQGPHRL